MEIEPRRLRIKRISDKKAQRDETTHLGHAHTVQPCRNPSKGCWEVHRPRQRCGHMKITSVNVKIKCINVNQTLKAEKAYLEHANAVQPPANSSKHPHRVIGLIRWRWRRGWIEITPIKVKIENINEKPVQEDETTHHRPACATQPPPNVFMGFIYLAVNVAARRS